MSNDPNADDVLIDPCAAIQVLCKQSPTIYRLVDDRVADQHLFGTKESAGTWPKRMSLVIAYTTGGRADADLPAQSIRLEATCYGRDPEEASTLYLAFNRLCRETTREAVPTQNGNALVYWLSIDGSPRQDEDENLGMHYIRLYVLTRVAETPVP